MLGKIILCTLILSSSVWAYRCSESSCIDQRLGIGGYYGTFTTPESNSTNIGIYIPVGLKYYNERLYIGIESIYGIAQAKITYNQTNDIRREISHLVSNTAVHLGTNLGSLESPILLSFATYIDMQNNDSSEKRFLKVDMFLGANIFGRFILDKDIGLEYGAGYGYSVATRYYGDEFNVLNSSKHNQRFEASLGLIFTQSSNIKSTRKDFYMKVKGLYYINNAFDITTNQGQTLMYLSNKDISVMLETGISFGL